MGTAYHEAALQSTVDPINNPNGSQYQSDPSIVAALKTTRDHPCTLVEFPPRSMFIWARPNLTTERALALRNSLWVPDGPKATTNILKQLIVHIQEIPDDQYTAFDVASVVDGLKRFSKSNKYSLKEIYQPLRFCLSGRLEGVGVADQLCSLGKQESINRIHLAIELTEQHQE
eukprot:UN02653